MLGVDVATINASLEAMVVSWRELLGTEIPLALGEAAGKRDSRRFDVMVEDTIREYLEGFDDHARIIAEERGRGHAPRVAGQPECPWAKDPACLHVRRGGYGDLMFFADPVDGSSALEKRLAEALEPGSGSQPRTPHTVGDVLAEGSPKLWAFYPMISVTGVRAGRPTFSAMLDIGTRRLYLACEDFCKSVGLSPDDDYIPTKQSIESGGADVRFDPECRGTGYFTFHTDKDDAPYRSHLREILQVDFRSLLAGDPNVLNPGGGDEGAMAGPGRILHLTEEGRRFARLRGDKPLGFILSNGEKITEFLPWLAWAQFSKELVAYELSVQRPMTGDDGVLMAPPIDYYSVFEEEDKDGNTTVRVNEDKLAPLVRAERYRATVIVVPESNTAFRKALHATRPAEARRIVSPKLRPRG